MFIIGTAIYLNKSKKQNGITKNIDKKENQGKKVDKNKLENNISQNASWFDITEFTEVNNIVNITLNNGNETINFSIQKNIIQKK